jgi:hypothetical protein
VPRSRSSSAASRYQVSCARASTDACAGRRRQLGLAGLRGGELALDQGSPVAHQRLVAHLGLQRGTQLQQVVGQQPQPGVAQVGLHLGGPPGHLGLPAERLELAAQLDGQVGQPVEVDLHRVELAERLLLALAVLEDAGRLLDEAAAVLRTGRQDGVELALADHDVQLAADAAVAHQLLHVDQPAPAPLMEYSDAPSRNISRVTLTSA